MHAFSAHDIKLMPKVYKIKQNIPLSFTDNIHMTFVMISVIFECGMGGRDANHDRSFHEEKKDVNAYGLLSKVQDFHTYALTHNKTHTHKHIQTRNLMHRM